MKTKNDQRIFRTKKWIMRLLKSPFGLIRLILGSHRSPLPFEPSDVLWPISGCKILVITEANQPYAMPIRTVDSATNLAIENQDDPRAWYEFALQDSTLSFGQKIACLQRAVILNSNEPEIWWTLGCHYELEGRDWYGAANAFNHVIFLQPDNAAAWLSLAQLWGGRGVQSKVDEAMSRFRTLDPEGYQSLFPSIK